MSKVFLDSTFFVLNGDIFHTGIFTAISEIPSGGIMLKRLLCYPR